LDEIDAFLPDTMQNFTENIGLEEEINRFLSKQTKAARCVFVRRYYFCDSVSDIAARYGMKESAVKSLLYRVRDRLAAHLKKGGFA
jgi:RNA polymerase sigma-70 factor (ECF subfamily)